MKPAKSRLSLTAATAAALLFASHTPPAMASEDIRALLQLLVDKGVITQEEFDLKLKKATAQQEIKEFNEAQDIRRANSEIDKRAEAERKFKTQIYGQVSAGYYQASNMTSADKSADGMSDQPKGNNRVGLKVSRELDADNTAMITLESNFSARTGAIGRDSAGYGTANSNSPGAALFDREANVRWISKTYGTFILGRGPNLQNDLSSAFDARQNWNFGGLKPIGRYAGFHGASGINRADKLFRYISPVWEGFNLDTGVSFGGVTGNEEKGTNYYIGGRYKKGNVEIGYNHAEVKLGSASAPVQAVNNRVDFLAAKYTMDKLTLNTGYVITRNPNPIATINSTVLDGTFDTNKTAGRVNANTWFAGAIYRFTTELSWNAGYYAVDDRTASAGANDVQMFATGLTYSPYKEWDFFIDYASARRKGGNAAFTIYDKWVPDTSVGGVNGGYSESTKNQTGVSVGAQYKF
jgi:predicted porin